MPASIPPADPEGPADRRRAVFSRQAAGLEGRHALEHVPDGGRGRRRAVMRDDALRLIDDLTNRSVDPMFSDARLAPRSRGRVEIWFSRVIVFAICLAVGFAGSLIVRQLHSDPRKEVRDTLISQLNAENSRVDSLVKDTRAIREQVDVQSNKLGSSQDDGTMDRDTIGTGLGTVTGPGITLTLANPIAAGDGGSDGSTPREGQSNRIRVVTDLDLQQFVSLLWHAGAESIAINGYRIGVQTSVRTAGQTILIGVNQIQSPYKIQAIGDGDALANAMSAKTLPALYASYQASGMYPQVSKADSMTLQPADSGDVSFAKRSE